MSAEYCITVGVTNEFKNRVANEAKKQGRTLSSLVKQVLEAYLNSVNDTQPNIDFAAQIIILQQQYDKLLQQNKVLTQALNQTQEDVLNIQRQLNSINYVSAVPDCIVRNNTGD